VSTHDNRIQRFEGTAMQVNSFLIEGPTGVVVVDAQLTVSDATALRKVAESYEKPVAGLVLTHGHPDHYAGAATLLDGLDTPIIATSAVDAVIRRDDATKEAVVGPMMGSDWPTTRRFPDELIEPGATVDLGGLSLTVRDTGPGESDNDSIWSLDERTLFPGDIAYNQMHAYLADGRYEAWLATLNRLESELDQTVRLYVGHGDPTDRTALARQRAYVEAFVQAVESQRNATPDDRRRHVVATMHELLPTENLRFLMELSIEPVLATLSPH
jgi:glyoxylase-like metal-dependent hydrolase (beta-lactamase superfamily II)